MEAYHREPFFLFLKNIFSTVSGLRCNVWALLAQGLAPEPTGSGVALQYMGS